MGQIEGLHSEESESTATKKTGHKVRRMITEIIHPLTPTEDYAKGTLLQRVSPPPPPLHQKKQNQGLSISVQAMYHYVNSVTELIQAAFRKISDLNK